LGLQGTIQAIAKGAVFSSAHIAARNSLQPFVKDKTIPSQAAEVIAGGIGGGFQGLVLSPLLLLKTRVMTDPVFRSNMSLWQTTVASTKVGMNVIRKEGVSALMKGSIMFSGKRVADWSTRYLFAEYFEHLLLGRHPNQKLSTTEKAAASFLGGAASTVATIPMDVMVAQIQQASKAGQKVSAVEAFKTQMKEGGVMGVLSFSMRGLIARIGHVSLTTGKLPSLFDYRLPDTMTNNSHL
jgi:Mitochondrial carrier protein